MIRDIKDALLQKGWAGKTIDRADTAIRVNDILRMHVLLNYEYDAAIRGLENDGLAERLSALQRTARADAGKLSEIVLSCGGTAYNGTDLEPETFGIAGSNRDHIDRLLEAEREFAEVLEAEGKIEHQMRTRAILGVVQEHSDERSSTLTGATKRR